MGGETDAVGTTWARADMAMAAKQDGMGPLFWGRVGNRWDLGNSHCTPGTPPPLTLAQDTWQGPGTAVKRRKQGRAGPPDPTAPAVLAPPVAPDVGEVGALTSNTVLAA